uniref:Fanconi anemia group D2 protein n=2 Tax=Clastoptera arizonana TaxID=38151 RepID=A0A1B6D3Q6_9HEMI
MYKRRIRTGLSKQHALSTSSLSSVSSLSTDKVIQEYNPNNSKISIQSSQTSLNFKSPPKARSTPLFDKEINLDEDDDDSDDEIPPSPKKIRNNSTRSFNLSTSKNTASTNKKEDKQQSNLDSSINPKANQKNSSCVEDVLQSWGLDKTPPSKKIRNNSSRSFNLSTSKNTNSIKKKNDKQSNLDSNINPKSNQINLSYMEEVVQSCGLVLSKNESLNILYKDQAVFVRDLRKNLTSDPPEVSRNVENFIKDLIDHCNDDHKFKNCLLPTETSSKCDVARGATQDCFLRLLLLVDFLQTKVMDFLLDKMAEIVLSEDRPNSNTTVITWVRMILQCLRFLDRDVKGSTISDRLFDIILGSSDIIVQQEVINCLPDIIGDKEHHDAALELSKMVRSTPQLLAAVLEALTNLSLQSEVRAEIQPILLKALRKVEPDFLPNMIKFLFSGCETSNLSEIITALRTELVFDQSHKDICSVQVMVYSNLKDALLSSRHLADIWLKNINGVLSHLEHKPMDFLMILLLHAIAIDLPKQRSIETVLRNRIKSGHFLEGLVQETFQTHIAVVKEYFTTLLKIGTILLKSPDPTVAEFAATIYSDLFINVDGYWCKWIVVDLQVYIGAGDSANARSALNILQELTIDHHKKMRPFATILMMLLNKLNELQLNEIRQLMDTLCRIAYFSDDGDEDINDCVVLQDEIHMLIQKQMASSQLNVLRSGVVGSVMAIKHMVTISENSDSTDPTLDASKPTPRVKKAIPILELLLSGTKAKAEVQALAFDELSHMLATGSNLDPTLLFRMSTLMQDNLQDSFLLATSQYKPSNSVLDTSLQFKIEDNCDDVLVLNIGELVLSEAKSKEKNIVNRHLPLICLHPLLRLIRRLEIKDLTEIDGLLGCAISMPEPSVYSEFSTLSPLQQHLALHCLFHCINWLREVINCFSYLTKKGSASKILMRLRTLVWLQNLLRRCLPLAIEYVPPICHFAVTVTKPISTIDKPVKKPKKSRKKKTKKSEKKVDADDASQASADLSEAEELETTHNAPVLLADLQKYKQYFRELDIDVWLILMQTLTLTPKPEKEGEFSPELGPSELLFLMDDYVIKVTRSLSPSVKRICHLKTAANLNVGFDNLDYFSSINIAKNTTKLLPYLCTHLEKLMEYCENLTRACDGILDSSGMFAPGSAEIKKCQGRILQVLATLFAWSGFNSQANQELLLRALQKLGSRFSNESGKKATKKLLIHECIKYLEQCESRVLDLSAAVSLTALIKALLKHVDSDKELQNRLAAVAFEFLTRQWYDLNGNREKGATLNSSVDTLLNLYFHCSKQGLETIMKTLEWLLTEVQDLNDKDATLQSFPVFSKSNLHLLIAGILKSLESSVKEEIADKSDNDQIKIWLIFTEAMESVVAVVKAQDTKPNLKAFVKGSIIVLRLFLSQAMPTCTYMFKTDPPLVTQVLKKLQITTRYLQTVCNFIKVSRDAGLNQYLAPVRAVMETILLKVKNLVILNNCSDAFFMGSMKNRDLKGDLITSEIYEDEDQGEEAENSGHENKDTENEEESDEEEDVSNHSISQAC